MLSAVILQLKQQHEINEAEWNEKVENNWLAIDGVLNTSLNFAISRPSKLEFIGVSREINAYKVMVLSGTTHVIRGILIIHSAQRYWKEKKQMKINQTRTMLIPEILPLRTNLFVMSSRTVQNRYQECASLPTHFTLGAHCYAKVFWDVVTRTIVKGKYKNTSTLA